MSGIRGAMLFIMSGIRAAPTSLEQAWNLMVFRAPITACRLTGPDSSEYYLVCCIIYCIVFPVLSVIMYLSTLAQAWGRPG